MTIDPTLWGWPQYVMVGVFGINMLLHAALNGRAMDRKYCAGCQVTNVAISAFILWAGGFWS
jgi:hypothetical protein